MRLCGILSMVFFLLSSSCTPYRLENWVFYKGRIRYKIGQIESHWRPVKIEENDVAFYNRNFFAIMATNVTCRSDYTKVDLRLMTSHLFYDLTNRKIIKQEKEKAGKLEGWRTEFSGKLKNTNVRSTVIVFRNGMCIYDFIYITRPHNYGRGLGDFWRVVYGFKVLEQ